MIRRVGILINLLAMLGATDLSYALDSKRVAAEHRAHIKYRLTGADYSDSSIINPTDRNSPLLSGVDMRSSNRFRYTDFEAELDGEFLGVGGPNISASSSDELQSGLQLFETETLPSDSRRLFDLTKQYDSHSDFEYAVRLDRASLAYLNSDLSFRIGRQAVTFGNGLAFQVLDLVNPFSPFAIDKEYKTGDDLAYGQFALNSESTISAALVPRRELDTGDLESDQSTAALFYSTRIAEVGAELQMSVGKDYGDWFTGAGGSYGVWDGVVRTDLRLNRLDATDNYRLNGVLNWDRSWLLFNKNIYGFIEYYRNSSGIEDVNFSTVTSSPDVIEQLERGSIYTLGRDLLALGSRIELHPLANLHFSWIANLNDQSSVVQSRLEYDILQDLVLTVGANIPIGSRESEFGGVRLPDSSTTQPGDELYLRVAVYR